MSEEELDEIERSLALAHELARVFDVPAEAIVTIDGGEAFEIWRRAKGLAK